MPSDRPARPHGTFTPASTISGVLKRAGYSQFNVRTSVHTAFGGHRCSWDRLQEIVRVVYWCGDDAPDDADAREAERTEMLDLYEQTLTEKGYRVERTTSRRTLRVHPKKK